MALAGKASGVRPRCCMATKKPAQLGKWRLSLLNEDNAVEQIHKTLVDSQRSPCASATSRPVHEAITYLENHREDMRYATARRLWLAGRLWQRRSHLQEFCLRSASGAPAAAGKRTRRPHRRPARPRAERPAAVEPSRSPCRHLRQHVSVSANPHTKLSCARMRSTPSAWALVWQ